MRVANLLSALLLPALLTAQTTARFVEVQVSDSIRLPFEGMDLEVRMTSPYDAAMEMISQAGDDDAPDDKVFAQAEQETAAGEAAFLALMKSGGYTYRLQSTEQAQDYTGRWNKTYDVNTYLVQLKAAEMEGYYKATQGHNGWSGTPKQAHYGDAGEEAPRLMKRLYDKARKEADALAVVSGGHLGKLISAQEVQRSEGSVLEQLFQLEKAGHKEDMLWQLGSTEQATMAFRFELLD